MEPFQIGMIVFGVAALLAVLTFIVICIWWIRRKNIQQNLIIEDQKRHMIAYGTPVGDDVHL